MPNHPVAPCHGIICNPRGRDFFSSLLELSRLRRTANRLLRSLPWACCSPQTITNPAVPAHELPSQSETVRDVVVRRPGKVPDSPKANPLLRRREHTVLAVLLT